MRRRSHRPKRRLAAIVLAVVIIVALAIAISLIYQTSSPMDYSEKVFPGQTYLAWNGTAQPAGYVLKAIRFALYVNGSVVLSSEANQSAWTCPVYVYGQEGNPGYKVGYAIVSTESVRSP